MAKKSTVGGPKSRRTTAEDLERRKQYRSRAERERQFQRRVLLITGALIAISVVILAAALINEQVIRPRQWIVKVDNTEISTRDFQDRVRLERWQAAEYVRYIYAIVGGDPNTVQQYASQQITNLRYPSLMGDEVLTGLEEDVLIELRADDYGIEVDDAAIDAAVEEFMAQRVGLNVPSDETPTPTLEPTLTLTPLVSPTPTNTPEPTTTPTPEPTAEDATPGPTETPTETPEPTATFTPTATLVEDEILATIDAQQDTYFDDVSGGADIDRDTVREWFYYQALRDAMHEEIGQSVKPEELQVNARHILISFNPGLDPGTAPPPTEEQKAETLAKAEDVMAALQSGEPFADLAQAVSDDVASATNPGSATRGGELGWSNPEGFGPDPEGFGPAFQDAVLNAELGEIVGPIETEFGYHIIQVHQREIRALTEGELQTRRDQAFQDWIDGERALADIERRSDWRDRIPEDPSYNRLLGDILPVG